MKRIECEGAGDNDGFFEMSEEVGVSKTAGCSTANELDEIMTLVFDAERYLKNVTMGGTQYGMAEDKLREARMKYLAYRAKP